MCSVVICSSIPIAIFYLHLYLNLNLNLYIHIHLHLHQVYCFRFLQNRRFFIRNRRFPVMKPADRSAEPPVSVCRRIKLSTEKQMAGQKKQVYRETRYTCCRNRLMLKFHQNGLKQNQVCCTYHTSLRRYTMPRRCK